jgi:hypothetical protein
MKRCIVRPLLTDARVLLDLATIRQHIERFVSGQQQTEPIAVAARKEIVEEVAVV